MKFSIRHNLSRGIIYEADIDCRKTDSPATKLGAAAVVSVKNGVSLFEANLRGADLRGADLTRANLYGADLRGADLYDADLRGADLYDADLRGADLRGVSLFEANLRGADLRGADLRGADLYDADLYDADLRGADLRGANLYDADLRGADLPDFQIPEGSLIGWKTVQQKIVKLSIPEKARRTASLVGRKCRAEYAICLDVEGADEVSTRGVTYRKGKTIRPDKYDDDPRVECTNGIYFFLTRKEAEEW